MVTAFKSFDQAKAFHKRKKLKQAIAYYKKASKILEEEYAHNAALIMHGLIMAYEQTCNYKEALTIGRTLLAHEEKFYGSDSLKVAKTANTLAGLSALTRDLKRAEFFQLKSLQISKKLLDPKDLRLATVLTNTGGIYRFKKKYKLAEKYFTHALSIIDHVKGRKGPVTFRAFRDLLDVWKLMGKTKPQIKRSIKAYWKNIQIR